MISPLSPLTTLDTLSAPKTTELSSAQSGQAGRDDTLVRDKFDQFVGETFYGQMLKAMHKMTEKPAYFHGGRAEEAFQGQLDQVLSEKMTEASKGKFSSSMYDLFSLQRG